MKLIKKCAVCKRPTGWHKGGCPGMRIYTRKEKIAGVFIILRSGIASVVLAYISMWALGADWTEYNTPPHDTDIEVMEIRPNVKGSAADLIEKHKNCYSNDIKKKFKNAEPIGVIMKWEYNDPYFFTKNPKLLDRAINQAVWKHNEHIAGVAAFCYRFKKGKAVDAPGYSISF